MTAFEPGASEVFTHGLRVSPRWFALRASRPAAIMLRGLLVLVQLVIAAMITAPSGIRPGSFSHLAADAARGQLGRPANGGADSTGRPCVRTTVERSNFSTRSYSRVLQAVGPQAGFLRIGLHQLDQFVVAAGELAGT